MLRSVASAFAAILIGFASSVSPSVQAQSAAEILESARAQAREFNELKAALNDPDQNVRLAVFDAMLKHSNPALRMSAIETGLMSTDSIMRARALHAQIFGMTQLHIKLAVDPQSTAKQQDAAKAYLQKEGDVLLINLYRKDPATGELGNNGNWTGQVNNQQLLLQAGTAHRLKLSLQDDGSLAGEGFISNTPYKATLRML
jgi:hypothetical protein